MPTSSAANSKNKPHGNEAKQHRSHSGRGGTGNEDDKGNARKELPYKSYIGALAVFNLAFGNLLWRARPQIKQNALTWEDFALLGVATHKLSRMLTKDVVTEPLRAPFTKFEDFLGYGEVQEDSLPQARGMRRLFGELISCNYCMDPWIALGLLHGLRYAPETTRLALKFFSSVALADFLHVGYERARTEENVLTLREEKLEAARPAA